MNGVDSNKKIFNTYKLRIYDYQYSLTSILKELKKFLIILEKE